jgi:S-phase kinase-associated protein 1
VYCFFKDLGDASDAPIPLPNVNAKILEKVIEYCKHHYQNPTPASEEKKDEKRTDDISPWDRDFCQVDQATLFELILVSKTKKNHPLFFNLSEKSPHLRLFLFLGFW